MKTKKIKWKVALLSLSALSILGSGIISTIVLSSCGNTSSNVPEQNPPTVGPQNPDTPQDQNPSTPSVPNINETPTSIPSIPTIPDAVNKQPTKPNFETTNYSHGIDKEYVFNQAKLPEKNDFNELFTTYFKNINIVKDENYSLDRTQFQNNNDYYTCALLEDPNFIGIPGADNKWNRKNSKSFQKVTDILSQNFPQYQIESKEWWDEFYRVLTQQYIRIMRENQPQPGIDFTNADFIINEIKKGTFKKHKAIVENMYGDFSIKYTQPGVKKYFSFSPLIRYIETGLYAPAGELITIHIDKNDVQNIRSFNYKIHIGEEFQDVSKVERYWEWTRLPYTSIRFDLNVLLDNTVPNPDGSYDVKFGSVYGGTISLENQNLFPYWGPAYKVENYGNIKFSIKDAVEYPCFILGFTTEQEWKRLMNETIAPCIVASNGFTNVHKLLLNYNSDGSLNKYFYNTAMKNSPEALMKQYKQYSMISNYVAGYNDFLSGKTEVNIYVGDYVSAGLAVNHLSDNTSSIQAPNDWMSMLCDPNAPKATNASSFWGECHELNHAYDKVTPPFERLIEVYNNVLTILGNAAFSWYSINRNEMNMNEFYSSGWMSTYSAFSSMSPRYDQNGSWMYTSSGGYHKSYAETFAIIIGNIGPELYLTLARLFTYVNSIKSSNNTVSYNGVEYDYRAVCAFLFSWVSKVDMTDFIETSVFSGLLTEPNTQRDLAKFKKYAKENYEPFYPFANFYATGNFLFDKKNGWHYTSDGVRPYKISSIWPTIFDLDKTTKFTKKPNNPNEPVKIKEFKIVNENQLKYGHINYLENNKFEYVPNPGSPVNKSEEIAVWIKDTLGNPYMFLIRGLLSDLSSYTNTIYTYNPNATFNINGQQVNFKQAVVSSSSDEQNCQIVKQIFNEPNNFLDNNFIVDKQSKIYPMTSQLGIDESIAQNQIREIKMLFKCDQTGYYRINGQFTHGNYSNFDYGYIYDINNSQNKQELISNFRWLGNANGDRWGVDFEHETKQVYLQKDKIYEVKFFSIIKDENLTKSDTFNKITINYLGQDPQSLLNRIPDCYQPWANMICIPNNKDTWLDFLNKPIQENIDYSQIMDTSFIFNTNIQEQNIQLNSTAWLNSICNYNSNKPETFENASILPSTKLVDSNDVTINRFLGFANDWVQCQNNLSTGTTFGLEFKLTKPIKFNEITFNLDIKHSYTSPQKIKLSKFNANSNQWEIIYDDFITEWWSNPRIEFNETQTLNHFRIEFIKAVDKRETTPVEFQQLSQDNLTGWIRMKSNVVQFKLNFKDYNTQNINYIYDTLCKQLKITGNWNCTSYNAIWNNIQLVSRNPNDKIEFNVKNVKNVFIIGDWLANSNAEFEIYIDGKLYETFNNLFVNDLPGSVLGVIKIPDINSHKITLLTKTSSSTNPLFIQGFAIQENLKIN